MFDHTARRGVVVRGRLLDGLTGQPVASFINADSARPLPPLTLQPWGEIRRRIVDDAGQPRRRISLTAGGSVATGRLKLQPIGIFPGATLGGGVATDDQARFTIVGLVPGLHYSASALDQSDNDVLIGDLFDDVRIEPGQVRDLGDLKVRPFPQR